MLETRYETTYAYDALGQLLRVNDQLAGTTCTNAYELGGNLLEKKRYAYTPEADLSAIMPEQTVPYAYADPNWKDSLTSYDGHTITYDAIGNPLTYDGWTYTWKAGRMLESMTSADTTAQFTYDHTDLRVKKSVVGVDTLYTLNGKRITGIRKGTNNATGEDAAELHFFYDALEKPMIARYMATDYACLHNLQGDVVGILDMNGASVVD